MKETTMMKIIIAVLAVLLIAGVTAYAATNYGTQDDPLITKSYLDDVVMPELTEEFEKKLDSAASKILQSAPGEFVRVNLNKDQTLYCSTGTEFLPAFGKLTAVGTMADTTAGSAVAAGDTLLEDHLYLVVEDGGASASGYSALLVCGSYRVE